MIAFVVALGVLGAAPTPAWAAAAVPVQRVWGQTAVGTAAAVSADVFPAGVSTVYVATVSGYWDALSGGAAAAKQGGPMLLTEAGALPQETRDELTRLRPSTIVIQGGALAVSPAVESELASYAPAVVRNAGDTAIGTAVLTSQRAFPSGASSVFVATAASFYDALSGGAAAGRNGAPVLLVDPTTSVDSRVLAEIGRLGADTVHLLGGPFALPDEIEDQIAATGVPVRRLWGETALATSLEINRVTVTSAKRVYLVTEQAYYDGLAAGPAASVSDGTVVLTNGRCISSAAKAYVLALNPSQVVIAGGSLAMAVELETLTGCTPEITTPDLRTATVKTFYSASLTGAGGVAPYSWTATGLPPGLALDPASGVIAGVPTAKGTFQVGVTLSDASGQRVTATVGLRVDLPPSGIVAIAPGAKHTCSLTAGGAVWCWGNNIDGQLGGAKDNQFVPVPVPDLQGGVAAIASMSDTTCAVTDTGEVKCWGNNMMHQAGGIGGGIQPTPATVAELGRGVRAIAVGSVHGCAVTAEGGVKCWGNNEYGQLGDGSTYYRRPTPVSVSGLADRVTAISVGYVFTCALTIEGAVQCWGGNATGQLGDGTTTNRSVPVTVSGLAGGVTAISAGGTHACALMASGAVKCWGRNYSGQLGDDTTTDRLSPVDVVGLAGPATAITGGGLHTCALMAVGPTMCWGNNGAGQLGDNSTIQRTRPSAFVVDYDFATIAAGAVHTCAATRGGVARCWGSNAYGQLGDGTLRSWTAPSLVRFP